MIKNDKPIAVEHTISRNTFSVSYYAKKTPSLLCQKKKTDKK